MSRMTDAELRATYHDPSVPSRIDGMRAIELEARKRAFEEAVEICKNMTPKMKYRDSEYQCGHLDTKHGCADEIHAYAAKDAN